MFSTLWYENLISIWSIYDHFPQDGLAWKATWERLFRKNVRFRKNEVQKIVGNFEKMLRKGYRKMIRGSREVRVGQNLAANPLEGLPEARNQFKNSKNGKNKKYIYSTISEYLLYKLFRQITSFIKVCAVFHFGF